MSKSFKASEVAEHKKPDSLWIIIDGDVYDVSKVCSPILTPVVSVESKKRQRNRN